MGFFIKKQYVFAIHFFLIYLLIFKNNLSDDVIFKHFNIVFFFTISNNYKEYFDNLGKERP